MTIEYVLLLVMGGVLFMGTLIKAPKFAFEQGGARLAARVEVQLSTGTGFQPYKGSGSGGSSSEKDRVPWIETD
jgi:hypothetical protein